MPFVMTGVSIFGESSPTRSVGWKVRSMDRSRNTMSDLRVSETDISQEDGDYENVNSVQVLLADRVRWAPSVGPGGRFFYQKDGDQPMNPDQKRASWLRHGYARFISALGHGPATAVAAAASAAGTAIITLGVPFATEMVANMKQPQELVAVFSEPVNDATASNSCGAGAQVLPTSAGQSRLIDTRPHEKQTEFWNRSKLGRIVSATVQDESGVGHGRIFGFEKSRSTMANFDSMSASFDGDVVGRGTYNLERHYASGAADPWWHGHHTFYDCHAGVMVTVPIVVGPKDLRKQMEADAWLNTDSWIEVSPATPVVQRTASK